MYNAACCCSPYMSMIRSSSSIASVTSHPIDRSSSSTPRLKSAGCVTSSSPRRINRSQRISCRCSQSTVSSNTHAGRADNSTMVSDGSNSDSSLGTACSGRSSPTAPKKPLQSRRPWGLFRKCWRLDASDNTPSMSTSTHCPGGPGLSCHRADACMQHGHYLPPSLRRHATSITNRLGSRRLRRRARHGFHAHAQPYHV